MSNPYPPTPSFGGAYNGYHMSDAGARDGGFQTMGGEVPPAPPLRGGYNTATTSNPMPTSATNSQSFLANATVSNSAPGVSPSVPTPPFHVPPDFFRRFSHSNLPPPPYPPVPIPHLGFPQFSPSVQNFAATSAPNNPLLRSSLLPQQESLPTHSPYAAADHQQGPFMVTREEGELSDGELNGSSLDPVVEPRRPVQMDGAILSFMPGKASSSSQEARFTAQPVTSSAGLKTADAGATLTPASGPSGGALSKADNFSSVLQRPSDVGEDGAPSADNDSISSYNPPSASTPDHADPDLRSVHSYTNGSHPVNPSKTKEMDHPNKSTFILREQVKDALRSLMPHNIRYNELVAEGVNPYLLRSLYEDLGQGIAHEVVQATLNSPVVEVEQICRPQNGAPLSPQAALDLPTPSSNDAGQGLQQAANKRGSDPKPIQGSSAPESQAISNVPDTPQALVSDAPSAEKTHVVLPSSDVAMERKDRIAQLLAAKTGKAIPPRLATEKQPHSSTKYLDSNSPLEAAKKPSSVVEKPPLPSPEPLVRPKNKAQTELIRQKMEALRKEALCKAHVHETAKAPSVTSSPVSPTSSCATQPQQSDLTGFVATVDASELASQIPGLFMTSEPYPADPNSTNEGADRIPIEKGDPTNIDSIATPVSQGTSAELENDSIQSASGQTLPVRVPQKRPLAADSFDEPITSLKRPFGRKDSHDKVEIVVSDAESEGEVEDVEMELDEESDEEERRRQDDVVPSVSRRQHNIRNLRPLTDIPSPKLVVHHTSGVATPTPTAVQTPGKEKEKEELWKAKHQEIELMRKKIAEMEERRKAKHNATRAISPKTTGKAGLPLIRTSLARLSQAASPGLAKSPIAVKVELSSNAPHSPTLTATRPEGPPSSPSTALSVLKEMPKSDNLRQTLLKRKATREGTPSTAEIEHRQAQLAEKRAKVAELRREAERREAEILEESRMLEAQLQAGLTGDDASGERPSTAEDDVEDGTDLRDQEAGDSRAQSHGDTQGANAERVPTAIKASPAGEAGSHNPLADGNTVLVSSNGNGDLKGIAASEPKLTSSGYDLVAGNEWMGHSRDKPGDDEVEIVTMMQQGGPSAVPVTGASGTGIKSPSILNEDKFADHARSVTVNSTHVDEDGSVSMSDSASEDYEPAEPDQIVEDQHEEDSEFYEPADVGIPADAAKLASPEQGEVAHPINIDLPAPQSLAQPLSPMTASRDPPILVDDSRDGMQLTEPGTITKAHIVSRSQEDGSHDKISERSSHFSPYETPRRYFKNFRYHGSFPEMVSSGYKSLTFSNNIDPKTPFCPTELAGETCQNARCEEQHFSQVALTDDKILAQMSTANNLKTKSEHDRWVAGLRQVIADLRSRGVKDFHMVASALVAYRRRFSEELSTPASSSSHS